jgi:glucuronate isomerase
MTGSAELRSRLLEEIMAMRAIDVHSHVPAGAPFATGLRDILGYHYYTELAHSAGMPRDVVAPGSPDERMIPGLLEAMARIDNTVQYSWLIELCRELFGLDAPRLTPQNWEPVAEQVRARAGREGRAREIMELSRIDKVFLTNNFDEDLSAVDTDLFVPSDCTRRRCGMPWRRPEGLRSATRPACAGPWAPSCRTSATTERAAPRSRFPRASPCGP